MDYFPLFVRLQDQPVLVIGAGPVAARKVALLLAAEASVTVVAPAMCAEIEHLSSAGKVSFVRSAFSTDLVRGQRLVVAATDDEATNEAVYQAAVKAGLLVNVVDDIARSNCIVPAIIDRSPVLVACSTGGSSPVLATELRAQLETLLPPRLGTLACFARRHRAVVKTRFPDLEQRRRFWLTVMRGEIAAKVLADRVAEAEQLLLHHLSEGSEVSSRGQCVLIMLRSEDPDELKLGALRALFATDRILHDEGVAPALLNLGRRDAPRQSLVLASSADDFLRSRLLVLTPLVAASTIVYLSHQGAWADCLVRELRALDVLTQVW